MSKNIKEREMLKTPEVIERLGKRFSSPEYALLTQVRNGTGYTRSARTADAIFMSLWPSRGIYLAGVEVKVSRTDWLKELADPKKADDLARYCDYWYLAVGDETIVRDGELPVTWGLMIPDGKGGMKTIKEAHKLTPEPIDRTFLTGIMRNMTERMVARETIEAELSRRYEQGIERGKNEYKYALEEFQKLQEQLKIFEKSSGIKIERYGDMNNIGEAVKEVLSGRDKEAASRLNKLRERTENILKYINGEEISSYNC